MNEENLNNDNAIEPVVEFKAYSDRMVWSVKDKKSSSNLFEISGYDLRITHNRDVIKDADDMETLLDGIRELFSKLLMEDLLEK